MLTLHSYLSLDLKDDLCGRPVPRLHGPRHEAGPLGGQVGAGHVHQVVRLAQQVEVVHGAGAAEAHGAAVEQVVASPHALHVSEVG